MQAKLATLSLALVGACSAEAAQEAKTWFSMPLLCDHERKEHISWGDTPDVHFDVIQRTWFGVWDHGGIEELHPTRAPNITSYICGRAHCWGNLCNPIVFCPVGSVCENEGWVPPAQTCLQTALWDLAETSVTVLCGAHTIIDGPTAAHDYEVGIKYGSIVLGLPIDPSLFGL